MALENCPQCGESISDKAPKCVHCGWERPVEECKPEPRLCPECAEVLEDAVTECPKCGCPIETDVTEKREETPAKVELTSVKFDNKTKKLVMAAVSAVLVIACLIGVGAFISDQQNKQKAEDAYNEYVANIENASISMLSGASQAETTCNTVTNIWHSAIYKGKKKSKWDSEIQPYYSSDFNTAIKNYYSSATGSSAVSKIESNRDTVSDYMKKLNNPPDDLKNAYSTLSDMYDSYTVLTDLAISPSGNYNEYSEKVNDAVTKFASGYKKLDTQIPEASPE